MSQKILINVFHPSLERSRYNKALIQVASGLENVTLRKLYPLYPNHQVDAIAEQEVLLEHDIIVFQHPFYWYSAPALMKEWQDQVLGYGFAFGSMGSKLQDKVWAQAVTVGTAFESYGAGKPNPYSVEELLRPFELTARFCGMRYAKPYVFHGFKSLNSNAPNGDPTDQEVLQKAQGYCGFLQKLSENI